MKNFAPLILLVFFSGCMTRGACGRAKMDSKDSPTDHVERPGYYFLIPFTVVGDIVTAPVQAYLHFTSAREQTWTHGSNYDALRFLVWRIARWPQALCKK